MRQVQSDEVRRGFGKILNDVEYRDQHVQVLRYDNPAAVLVPNEWHKAVFALLDDLEAYEAWRDRALALRRGRRAAGLSPQDPRMVDHIDSDPTNNDPDNLRVVDPRENGA